MRPSVFGAMDGLVSNFALIAGVAGGNANPRVIALSGVAGLAAGALSMAGGEYVSVASQRELAQAEIAVERGELARHPDDERAELAQSFVDQGVTQELADEVARQISQNPDRALEVHARAELGITPDELPSPRVAAVSSFVSFSVGAALPLLPFLLGARELVVSAVVSCVALFVAGAVVSTVTARSWWYSGLRQFVVGAVAAGVTFSVGSLIGVAGL
ncbi:Predicted Fe2+/Mn2+ transporter, VIT1/CCC1 family [Nonomuraea jiangxiensis]|uniref:Predicted Fe2+/Mn2+ transporter, VIT1/CCC1 family n=1 Tax=Nonomuraea jiangxiensis TaxID=633440 RepID=A0A1G8HPR5_9ACTN|nr:Predicted Fe2+/Mn2+ transporter, VIT1/CCC1 family [Nonomuraea jiangxiensis]